MRSAENPKQLTEDREALGRLLDEALAETFLASDPVAIGIERKTAGEPSQRPPAK